MLEALFFSSVPRDISRDLQGQNKATGPWADGTVLIHTEFRNFKSR